MRHYTSGFIDNTKLDQKVEEVIDEYKLRFEAFGREYDRIEDRESIDYRFIEGSDGWWETALVSENVEFHIAIEGSSPNKDLEGYMLRGMLSYDDSSLPHDLGADIELAGYDSAWEKLF